MKKCALVVSALIVVLGSLSVVQGESLSFNQGMTAIPGGFRFLNVTPGVDALITAIDSRGTVSDSLGNSVGDDLRVVLIDPVPSTDPAVLYQFEFVEAGTTTPTTLSFVELRIYGFDSQGGFTEHVTVKDFSSYALDLGQLHHVAEMDEWFLLEDGCSFTPQTDAPPDAVVVRYTDVSTILLEYSAPGTDGFVVPSRGMDVDGSMQYPILQEQEFMICGEAPPEPVPALGSLALILLVGVVGLIGVYLLRSRL